MTGTSSSHTSSFALGIFFDCQKAFFCRRRGLAPDSYLDRMLHEKQLGRVLRELSAALDVYEANGPRANADTSLLHMIWENRRADKAWYATYYSIRRGCVRCLYMPATEAGLWRAAMPSPFPIKSTLTSDGQATFEGQLTSYDRAAFRQDMFTWRMIKQTMRVKFERFGFHGLKERPYYFHTFEGLD